MIEITESAQVYLRELLGKQDDQEVAIRVFVAQPGTPHAETCIACAFQDQARGLVTEIEADTVYQAEKAKLVAALESRDRQAAHRAMRNHLKTVRDALLKDD